ncbi:hypothetical protein AMAG_18983 [Allomyces macrogynus ATCC 38327]|uniref:Ras-GEF domain-containing protein n=1 Tax=Allomyces macrogynus (strain ATCC 38327) TaxID=578462 RepID=A0A0L0SLL7_ALLM3|nr:hypothetical protein AMAG_18983 [Allomyces macrogynus ATCC 38327]|eukprot:KNE63279.1 hypothetical protein AMAG_18983 [Allomyces macrogynus ATCC 38327]
MRAADPAAADAGRPVPVAPGHVHRLAQHFEPRDASSSTIYIPMPAPAPYLLGSRRASLAPAPAPSKNGETARAGRAGRWDGKFYGVVGVRECLDAVEDLVESLERNNAEENEIQGVRDPAPAGDGDGGEAVGEGNAPVVSGSPSSIKADSEETVVVPAPGPEKSNKEVDKGEAAERAVSFEGLPALTLARRVRRTLANIVLGARKDTHVPWFQASSRHVATVMTELDGTAWHGVRARLASAIAKGENVNHDVFAAMATRFNKTSKAVTDACTTPGITEGTRSALVQKFVRVCEHLLAMHNLAAVQAIATALATLPRSARYILPATEAAVLAHIMHLTSPVGNFARMRHLAAHWARHGDACVPLVVPYLRDMAVAHEIGPDGAKRMPLLDWRELATARPPEVAGYEGPNAVVAGLIV